MKTKCFMQTLNDMKYGLVKLTADFKISDKNEVADAIFPLPRRGSDLSKYLEIDKAVLTSLASFNAVTVLISRKGFRKNAIAFRASDGGIMLLFHPVLSTLKLGNNEARINKILQFYSKNIFEMLETAIKYQSEEKLSGIPDKSFFEDFSIGKLRAVNSVVDSLVKRLAETVLNRELSVVVDTNVASKLGKISEAEVDFVVSEILAIREYYGESDNARLQIGCYENCLAVVLIDKADDNSSVKDNHYLNVFLSLMQVIDIGSYAGIDGSGELVIKAYIPFV